MNESASATGWRRLADRRFVVCIFLGFSSGLPLYVMLNLVQLMLRRGGVDLKSIGLFALIQFPYTWKFLWAPLMDRYALPWLGRRRGWMMVMQLAVLLGIAALGTRDAATQLGQIALLVTLLSFFSASLDIVIDAFRREMLADDQQGMGTAIHVNAYKLSGLVPSALAFILADYLPWSAVFAITASFMLPGMIMTLVVAEPVVYGAPPADLRQAVVLPFREFIERSGWTSAILLLAFILFYKLGDSLATSLATSFFVDLGFTNSQIGEVAKGVGLWASVAGGLLGGAWLMVIGINRGLWIFGFLQLISIFGYAVLAISGANLAVLAMAIGFEAFASAGLGTAALTAFMARATDTRYTATQLALFTSLAVVPRTFFNAFAGHVVELTGWFDFYLICAACAVPGLLLLPRVAPWTARRPR